MTGLAERAQAKYLFPSRKDEAFRYVQLGGLQLEPGEGKFETQGEALVMTLEQAVKTFGAQLQVRQERWLFEESDPFALFNGGHSKEAIFIYVAPKQEGQLTLKHSGDEGLLLPRCLIHVGRGAKLKLNVEQTGLAANRFLDCLVEENGQLLIQFQGHAEKQMDSVRVNCKRDSYFKSVNVQSGTHFQRQSYEVNLLGENAIAELFGISEKSAQSHTHVLVRHTAENTRSSQKFKAVVGAEQRSSFEGKIYVEREAQKTQAYQLSQSLLLSPDAKAYSKPNLEIFADDVKASHGATVGQIDPEEIFYLQARGLSKEAAEELLIRGFVQEILNELS